MLEWIITSCVLIGIVLLVRLCLKNRISLRLRYALWLIVLVRLLVPVNFFNSSMSVMNVVPESATVAELQQPEIIDAPEQTPTQPITDTPVTQVPILPVNPTPITPVTPEVEEPVRLPQVQIPTQEESPEKTFSVTLLLQIIWIAGIAITGGVFLFANIRFALRLKRTRQPEHADCPLRVYRTAMIDTPCLFGVFRPAIYLTEQAGEDEGRHHILTHEMTHYKHLDHIWGLLRCLCLALHWYNPLVWVAAICSRRDSELACDEAVIKHLGEDSRAEYGKTLIRMTCTKQNAAGIFTTATTMTGSKKTIKNRIKLIVKHPKTALYAVICLVLIAAIAVGCTFTGAKPPEESVASTETTLEETETTEGKTETIEVSDPTETTSDVGASVPDDNLNWDYPYGRLVYIDGDLYAIQYVWNFGESAEKIGSITNCDFDAIPSTDFSSNYFPVGTEVYKDGSNYFIRHPIDDSDAEPRLIPLCKTTLDREGGAPMLTLNDVREIVKKGDMNLFLDFRGFSFLSGPLSRACEIRDYDGFIIIDWDRVRLLRLCDLASIDPFADDLEAFLAETGQNNANKSETNGAAYYFVKSKTVTFTDNEQWQLVTDLNEAGLPDTCTFTHNGKTYEEGTFQFKNNLFDTYSGYEVNGEVRSRYQYNSFGDLIVEKAYKDDFFFVDNTYVYTYDTNGNNLTENRFSEGYDMSLTTCTYDSNGNMITSEYDSADKYVTCTRKYQYDDGGNILKAELKWSTRPGSTYYIFEYDQGRLVRRADEFGVVTIYTYDGNGRIIEQSVTTQQGECSIYSYTYDEFGRCIRVTTIRDGELVCYTDYAYHSVCIYLNEAQKSLLKQYSLIFYPEANGKLEAEANLHFYIWNE